MTAAPDYAGFSDPHRAPDGKVVDLLSHRLARHRQVFSQQMFAVAEKNIADLRRINLVRLDPDDILQAVRIVLTCRLFLAVENERVKQALRVRRGRAGRPLTADEILQLIKDMDPDALAVRLA